MSHAPAHRRSRPRGGDPARMVAFDVLREVDTADSYANLLLPQVLASRGVHGRDAAFATELTYGALRMRGRYDAVITIAAQRSVDRIDPPVLDLLRLGCHQLLAMRVPDHAAVSQTVAMARALTGAGSSQFVNAVLRAVAGTPAPEWLGRIAEAAGPDPLARAAVVESHPLWVVRALREALLARGRSAEELGALLAADNESPRVTLVARPGLIGRRELIDQVRGTGDRPASRGGEPEAHRGGGPGRWSPMAVTLDRGEPGALPAVRQALAGVQDEGSQLVALALAAAPVEPAAGRSSRRQGGAPPAGDTQPAEDDVDPSAAAAPAERWLDLCAGPGGKAALLGALAAQRGAQLLANELAPHRARLVERAVSALPAGVVRVQTGDGRLLGSWQPAEFDRVLVDAPCTGLGALRRRPESRWRRTPADLAQLGPLQRDLLGSALLAVRPGGVVAYVTCSPHRAETDLVVRDVVRAHDVEQLDAAAVLATVLPDDETRAAADLGAGPLVQLWPHVHGTDAMFLALLRRTG